MTDDKSQITRWALGELSAVESAKLEAELSPMLRSEAEAHRDFCERAAEALARDGRGLPSHKRGAILAAFAVRESAAMKRRGKLMQVQRAVQGLLAACVILALGGIISQVPRRPFAAQQKGGGQTAAAARVDELEVANYRLAALTAYLEAAEARLRAAELAEAARQQEAKPKGPPRPGTAPKTVPEAHLHTPFTEPFAIAQIRPSL